MSTHDEIRDLLGAYALDAVDAAEHRALEQHVAGCASCRLEVAEHQQAAADLAPASDVPPAVWERIERAVDGERPVTRPGRRLASALVAAAVAAFAFLAWRVADLEARLDRIGGGSVVSAARAALTDPDARRVVLRSPGGSLAVDAVILPDGRGYVLQDNLDPLPTGQTYQLWAMTGRVPVSAGLLGPDPEVSAFRLGSGTTALAVTVEDEDGAPGPTTDPLASGTIS
jgi:anti-sigma-K factor RskA